MADLVRDHDEFCRARPRFYGPLAGLAWIASSALLGIVAGLLGLGGAAWHVATWLALGLLALDGWWQWRAAIARDAHLAALVAGAAIDDEATRALRRGLIRRRLLPADGDDPWRTALTWVCAAPRLTVAALRSQRERVGWGGEVVAQAAAFALALGRVAEHDGWRSAADLGEPHLLLGLYRLDAVELRLAATGPEARLVPRLRPSPGAREEAAVDRAFQQRHRPRDTGPSVIEVDGSIEKE